VTADVLDAGEDLVKHHNGVEYYAGKLKAGRAPGALRRPACGVIGIDTEAISCRGPRHEPLLLLHKVTEDRLRAKIKDALAARRDAEGNLPEDLFVSDIAEKIGVSSRP